MGYQKCFPMQFIDTMEFSINDLTSLDFARKHELSALSFLAVVELEDGVSSVKVPEVSDAVLLQELCMMRRHVLYGPALFCILLPLRE